MHIARENGRSKTVIDKDMKQDISIWDGAADANCRESIFAHWIPPAHFHTDFSNNEH